MGFEMRVVSNVPLIGEDDLETVTKKFLEQIGYLSKGSDPEIPYRLFVDFFLKYPNKAWMVDEIANTLKTSRPTVYRHLNKLKGLDILEETQVVDEQTGQSKKAYKLRYGDLEKAWNFVEAHLKVAIENYSKTVEHIQNLLNKQRRGGE
jgi:predicted transcriptional regulator